MGISAISVAERRSRLVRRHRLEPANRTDAIAEIAHDLFALHSSDPVTVYLSAAARMKNPTIEAISRSLHLAGKVLRHHAMRRTLWVFTPDRARVAHAATTMRYIPNERKRLIKMLEEGAGVNDGERWLAAAIDRAYATISEFGPIDTRSLGGLLPELTHPIQLAEGKSYASTTSALSRVLLQMGFEARIVRGEPIGSWINGQYKWQAVHEEVDVGLDPDLARAELIRQWLDRFGPGTETDIAWWAGLPLGMVRRALEQIGAIRVDLDSDIGWVNPDDLESPSDVAPSVALLPGLDPTAMGWKQRDWYLDPSHTSRLFDSNGNAGPSIWVDGRIVGGWAQGPDGRVAYQLLEDVGTHTMQMIENEAGRLEAFWGDTRFKVRFPSPSQRELLA